MQKGWSGSDYERKILLLGSGYLGTRIQEAFQCASSERKIFSFSDAEEEIAKYKPEILINCIGHIGTRNVDDCEADKDKTLFSNTFVPIILAEVALRNRIKMVHISSGCIYHFDYSKDKPIKEGQVPDFFDLFYSRSKIYAERALELLCNKFNVLIARIRIPLDDRPHPKNILTKLIKYKRAIDTPNSVTYVPDFIEALKHLIKIDARGIFNIVNKSSLKYPDLLEIYKRCIPDFEYDVIRHEDLKLVRTNLILSVEKLENSGFRVRDIGEVLEECVRNYLKYS